MKKLDYFLLYAKSDALHRRACLPALSDSLSERDKVIELAKFMSRCAMFSVNHIKDDDDPNLDNQKRNVAMRTFADCSISQIRQQGMDWLEKMRGKNGSRKWFLEWEFILKFGTDDEIAKIHLSADPDSTRQRISRPTVSLPFDVVLEVKRKGSPF